MDCLFCKIANGDIPADKIYEDEQVIAFNDIDPQAPVHFLVIPKMHIKSVDEIKQYCEVSKKERELLTSSARPIALLKKKKDLPQGICDDSDFIGAFLPCNPIQILILEKDDETCE